MSTAALEPHDHDSLLEHPDNEVFARCARDELHLILFFLGAVAIMVWLTRELPWSLQTVDLGEIIGWDIQVGIPLFALLPIMIGLVIMRRLYDRRYILTPEYVLQVEGLTSLRRRSLRLHYQHIRGVEIDVSFLDMILGSGDVLLFSDVAQQNAQIALLGVSHPRAVKDRIEARIRERARHPVAEDTSAPG